MAAEPRSKLLEFNGYATRTRECRVSAQSSRCGCSAPRRRR
jgi:hypothetical protein